MGLDQSFYGQLLLLQAELVAPALDSVPEYLEFGDVGLVFYTQFYQVFTHLHSPSDFEKTSEVSLGDY